MLTRTCETESWPLSVSPEFNRHDRGEDHLLLLSENRSYSLNGKLYVELAGRMDGAACRNEIVASLDGQYDSQLVNVAIDHMVRQGYARSVHPSAPQERQALWSEMEYEPAELERRLESTTFHITPDHNSAGTIDASAIHALSRTISGCGLQPAHGEGDSDITIVVTGDYLSPGLATASDDIIGRGGLCIPFKPTGSQIWIGPVFGTDGGSCHTCLHRNIQGNRPGDGLIGNTGTALRPARSHIPATLQMAYGFAAIELAHFVAGDETLLDTILTYDVRTRSIERHKIRQFGECPVCSAARPAGRTDVEASARVRFEPRATTHNGTGWRVSSAGEVYEKLRPLVSPITGIVPDLVDISDSPDMPVYGAIQFFGGHVDPRQNRYVGKPNGAAGKGATAEEAKVSCLAEAVERYSCGYSGSEPRIRGRLEDFGGHALHPSVLLNFSERQYAERETRNRDCDPFSWIATPFDDSAEIEWSPGWSVINDRAVWLPTRYCYFNYSDDATAGQEEDDPFCKADSNGCASGSVLEEAVLQAALELVERDSAALWWYNRIRRPAFDLDAVADPMIERTRAFQTGRGRTLHVLDLTSDIGIPVCVAISADSAGKRVVMGLGAHLDANIAIKRAVAEHNQMAIYEPKGGAHAIGEAGARWLNEASLQSEPYLQPTATIRPPAPVAPPADIAEATRSCLQAIGSKAQDVIVYDMSRKDVDFACARVVAPGLRHFWPRLAPGRLYDAPVASGWVSKPLTEDELNPTPFFM